MDQIIFYDGTHVNTDFIVCSGGRLHCTLYGLTFLQAAQILSDPDATQEISVEGSNDLRHPYTGYTNLTALMMHCGHIKAILEVATA